MRKGDDCIPDIIVDILLKLPAKSVLRFKIASKTWYSLISDPVFIDVYSKRTSPRIMFNTTEYQSQIRFLDYESPSFDGRSCFSAPIHNFPVEISHDCAKIVGSCRGLVCVGTDFSGKRFSAWNPFTGECRKLPELGFRVMKNKKNRFHELGYDSIANDFKFVLTTGSNICCIFSLKANSWKAIKSDPVVFQYRNATLPSDTLATVLNGIFHWLDDCKIVAFDAGNETFQNLQLPQCDDVASNFRGRASLLEHKGSLCVSFAKYDKIYYKEIWMMKKYGNGWVHLLTVKNPLFSNCFRLPVLCISKRNEAVFHDGFNFIRYGMEKNKSDEIGIRECVYWTDVETLESPNTVDWLQPPIKRNRYKKLIIYE